MVLASQMLTGGGTERQLVELAKAIDKSRFEVHVFCFIDDEAKRLELLRNGVKVQVLPVRTFAGLSTVKLGFSFSRYLRRHRVRIFHAFDMPWAIFGAPVARLAGVPVVLTSCRGNRDLYSPIHRRMLRVSDRFAHGIVCNAQSLVDALVNHGLPPTLLRICHNGIDASKFLGPRVDSQTLTIGTVCLLRPEKNLEALLRAYASLRRRQGLKLRITGSGPLLGSLQALASSLGLTSTELSFQPTVASVAAELAGIDIFVLPSLSEGLSNSIMEAMASGCAVAASAVGGNLELVRDGETGMLFDPARFETLTGVLEKLIGDAPLRARLAANGVRFIQDGFSMAASARTMESIYEEFQPT